MYNGKDLRSQVLKRKTRGFSKKYRYPRRRYYVAPGDHEYHPDLYNEDSPLWVTQIRKVIEAGVIKMDFWV